MKKILLGIGLAVCSLVAQAQDYPKPFSLGPRVGANMANIWNETEDMSSSVFGANIGFVSNVRITKKHAIQTELLYSGKGFINDKIELKNSLHYVEIPVLYQRSFFSHKKGGHLAEKRRTGNMFLIMGPQLSILMKSTATFKNPEVSSEPMDLYVTTRPFDMSAVGGLGYSMKNGFSVDVRYALGLRHLHAASETAYIPKDVTNTAVQVGVSYLIPLNFR